MREGLWIYGKPKQASRVTIDTAGTTLLYYLGGLESPVPESYL
mgnify:CR=1 FL=1